MLRKNMVLTSKDGIAKAQGLDAIPIPATSSLGMYPHYMVREAFAIVKDLAIGNMVF